MHNIQPIEITFAPEGFPEIQVSAEVWTERDYVDSRLSSPPGPHVYIKEAEILETGEPFYFTHLPNSEQEEIIEALTEEFTEGRDA